MSESACVWWSWVGWAVRFPHKVNYPLRRKNRHIEKDGLEKAKAILEGGKFTAPKVRFMVQETEDERH